MPTTNEIIRQARQVAGLTQAELAERLGIPQSHLSRWETGKHACAVDTLHRLIAACGVSIALTTDGWQILLDKPTPP